MQGTAITYGLLSALAIALLIAAFTDLRRRQIDNWLNAAIAAGAPLFWWASGYSLVDVGWQLLLGFATFGVTTAMFALRGMGGGDVKLLTALSLWISPLNFLKLLIMMSLIGGILSVGAAARNMEVVAHERVRNALAKGAAVLWIMLSVYAIYVIGGGEAIALGSLADDLFSSRAAPVAMLALAAGVLVFLASGVRQIVRRQSKPLPIPYGLAISAAGLWLLACSYFPTLQDTTGLG